MQIRFFATYRDITLTKSIEVPAPETVRGLLELLCKKNGKTMREKLFLPDGSLSYDAIILVNGRHITHLDGIDTRLSDADTVSIFPMIAGG
jgi:molybdopterin synthase sulfur carrier subunit